MFSLSKSPVSVLSGAGAGAGQELGRGLSRSTTTCSHLAQAARPGHFTSPALSVRSHQVAGRGPHLGRGVAAAVRDPAPRPPPAAPPRPRHASQHHAPAQEGAEPRGGGGGGADLLPLRLLRGGSRLQLGSRPRQAVPAGHRGLRQQQ